ncbi:hypothetical protein [Alicyclobacillus fastidiosus]|uniref:Uncharacterized protein n=1 Tax=Alicyclobacillus fastidiosus TaxID=392011 RepID=A0ABV5AIB0_9BACL|nr:hypothetical protein [Alicyclobacillus fastidiosus]WEH11125.1 hypothetical protein PYS47_07875 [Alicyclobacillus fastidiosus]
MAFISATVEIIGTRPLLYHCFTPDTLSLEKQERTGRAGNDPEEWKRTFTATSSGQLFLDPSYIFGCLKGAGKYTKKARGSIQTDLVSTLLVTGDRILLDRYIPEDLNTITRDSEQPIYLDVRSVRNPTTKGRNIRYRLALSPGWSTQFNVMWDNTLVNREQMRAVCNDAGQLVGLGDGRSIGLGRFQVVSFEVRDAASATA